jgi:hypothetical protein
VYTFSQNIQVQSGNYYKKQKLSWLWFVKERKLLIVTGFIITIPFQILLIEHVEVAAFKIQMLYACTRIKIKS